MARRTGEIDRERESRRSGKVDTEERDQAEPI